MQSLPASGQADSKLKLDVSLASGRRETVSVLQHGTVCDLKIAAQQSLGQSFLRLAAPDGCLLDLAEALQVLGLQDGDTIAAIAQQPRLPRRVLKATGLSPGAIQKMVETAVQSKTSFRKFSKFVPQPLLLL